MSFGNLLNSWQLGALFPREFPRSIARNASTFDKAKSESLSALLIPATSKRAGRLSNERDEFFQRATDIFRDYDNNIIN